MIVRDIPPHGRVMIPTPHVCRGCGIEQSITIQEVAEVMPGDELDGCSRIAIHYSRDPTWISISWRKRDEQHDHTLHYCSQPGCLYMQKHFFASRPWL